MNDRELAKLLLEKVGGESNVISVVHCITRLRFKLKDESLANDEFIVNLDQVQGVVKKGGQYQIVLGPSFVNRIHAEVLKLGNFDNEVKEVEEKSEGSLFDKFVDIVASIFTPVLGILAGSGMIKGIAVLLMVTGVIKMGSTEYIIINGIGDAFFVYMPVIIGYFSMKKFGGTPMLGAALGGILLYPAITTLATGESINVLFEGTMFASQVKGTFFGVPLILPAAGYASSVLPIIALTYVSAKIQKVAQKFCPDYVALFFVPMITLFVGGILGLLIIGPVLSITSSLIAALLVSVRTLSPVIYAGFIAGTWQLLVMFGLHWAVMPMAYVEMAEMSAGNLEKMQVMAGMQVVSFATAGVVLAVFLKTKQKSLKNIALPAFLTALFGISEPSLYGITLPRKKLFITACIVSAVWGMFLGFNDVGAYTMAGMGIFSLPGNLNPNATSFAQQTDFIYAAISILGALVTGFLVTFFFVFKDDKKEEVKVAVEGSKDVSREFAIPVAKDLSLDILAPVVGKMISQVDISDDVFKNEIMGSTIAVRPTSNEVTSPVTGEVVALFPTKHAIGILSDSGVEVLVHVGVDTVELNGEHFELHVEINQRIEKGQPIVTVDFEKVRASGYDDATIVVVTNTPAFTEVKKSDVSEVKSKTVVMTAIKA